MNTAECLYLSPDNQRYNNKIRNTPIKLVEHASKKFEGYNHNSSLKKKIIQSLATKYKVA